MWPFRKKPKHFHSFRNEPYDLRDDDGKGAIFHGLRLVCDCGNVVDLGTDKQASDRSEG